MDELNQLLDEIEALERLIDKPYIAESRRSLLLEKLEELEERKELLQNLQD